MKIVSKQKQTFAHQQSFRTVKGAVTATRSPRIRTTAKRNHILMWNLAAASSSSALHLLTPNPNSQPSASCIKLCIKITYTGKSVPHAISECKGFQHAFHKIVSKPQVLTSDQIKKSAS